MERAARRDGRALEALYSRYGRPAYALARRILGDEQLAAEAVQEVFLSLWKDAGRFDPKRGTSVASYLLATTHHRAVDIVRKESRLREGRTSDDALAFEPDPTVDVEGQVLVDDDRAHVRTALAALPSAQREALALAYFGGYTQREIASLVDIPLGTVKTRMAAGMRRLRQVLELHAAGHGGMPGSVRPDEAGT